MRQYLDESRLNTWITGFDNLITERILFPFLLTSHFVLSLYLNNFYQLYFRHILRPLIIVLLGTFAVYSLARIFLNKNTAGILTLLIAISVFSFKTQIQLINPLFPHHILWYVEHYEKALIGLAVLNTVLIASIILAIKLREIDLEFTVKILNLIGLFLVATVLIGIISGFTGESASPDYNYDIGGSEVEDPPSIYYIIPDKYTRSDVLEEQYNFNNSKFLNSLEKKGFTVQENTYTNYGASYASLASSLNMDYLRSLGIDENSSEKQVHRLLEDHKVQEYLRGKGYTYYHIGGIYTEFNRNAEKSYFFFNEYFEGKLYINRFEEVLVDKTIFRDPESYKVNKYATSKSFDKLSNISKKNERKFVFTHVMSPHAPYTLPSSVDGVKFYKKNEASQQKRYAQEVKATNKLLNETISNILENDNNAIILIQGDEGPSLKNEDQRYSEEVNIKRKQSILFAHYTPDIEDEEFEGNVNPVNIFRILFNNQFNTSLELLPGRTYHVNGGENMDFYRKNLSYAID